MQKLLKFGFLAILPLGITHSVRAQVVYPDYSNPSLGYMPPPGNQCENNPVCINSGPISPTDAFNSIVRPAPGVGPNNAQYGFLNVLDFGNSIYNSSNTYTDTQVENGVASAKAYTDTKADSVTLQITSSGNSTANALGGGSTYSQNTGISAPSYTVRNATFNNVGSAINAINTQFGIYDNQIAGLNSSVGMLGAGLVSTNEKVDGVDRKASQGIAMAAAMAQAPMPSAPGKTSWKFNNAVYRNAGATSLSISHRLPTKVPVAVTGGVAIGLRNSAIVTGGLQGEF